MIANLMRVDLKKWQIANCESILNLTVIACFTQHLNADRKPRVPLRHDTAWFVSILHCRLSESEQQANY